MLRSRKLRFGLIYGLAAGLVFSLVSWGLNCLLLSGAHFAYPWLALLVGSVPVLLICGLAGYLSIGFENGLLAGVTWLVSGLLLGAFGIIVPLGIVPELLPRLEPVLKDWLIFSWQGSYAILAASAAIVTGIAFLILGLLEIVLIDQASYSPYSGAIFTPVLICALISGIAGGVVDNLANVRYRNSAMGLDRLFNFAVQNKGQAVDKTLARQMHMNAVSTIMDDLSDQRRLFFFEYTESADQGRILVEMNGRWVICTIFLEQPAFCQATEPPR